MSSVNRRIERDVRGMIAEEIDDFFGFDPSELDLEDNPHSAVAAFELEVDLDDEFVDEVSADIFLNDALGYGDEDEQEEFFELLYEEDEEDDDKPAGLSPLQSKVVQASMVRDRFGGKGKTKRFIKGLSSLVSAAGEGLASSGVTQDLLSSVAPGFLNGPMTLQSLSRQAGAALGSSSVLAEAADSLLPPVYVEDDVLPGSTEAETEEFDLDVEETFGSVAAAGLVNKMHRPRARKAAINALWRASKTVPSAPYGTPSSFVEDLRAKPVLLSDGRILEEMHGELSLAPCPSCTSVEGNAAFGAASRDCAVCDGFGALLVPEEDLPSFVSTESFGFVAALLPLVTAGVQLGSKIAASRNSSSDADLERRKREVLQRLLEMRKGSSAVASVPGGARVVEESAEEAAVEAMGGDFLEDEIDAWTTDVFGSDDVDDDDDDDSDEEEESDYAVVRILSPKARR